MLNQKPTFQKKKDGTLKYKQGLYIPRNKNKVIQLNDKGGLYYRSSYEKKVMIYLDNNDKIALWGCELYKVPYTLIEVKKNKSTGDMDRTSSQHTYYPDFYYELKREDGSVSKVLLEVKPKNEIDPPKLNEKSKTTKQLENFQYQMTVWNRNQFKWDAAINFCMQRNMQFAIMCEEEINIMTRRYSYLYNFD